MPSNKRKFTYNTLKFIKHNAAAFNSLECILIFIFNITTIKSILKNNTLAKTPADIMQQHLKNCTIFTYAFLLQMHCRKKPDEEHQENVRGRDKKTQCLLYYLSPHHLPSNNVKFNLQSAKGSEITGTSQHLSLLDTAVSEQLLGAQKCAPHTHM